MDNNQQLSIEKQEQKPVFQIQNYITARPPVRTQFDLGDWRNALVNAESTWGNRTTLYDLYADIMLDPVVTSCIERRELAITNTPLHFVVKKKQEEELTTLGNHPEFREAVIEALRSKWWGISLIEWRKKEDGTLGTFSVNRKHIHPLSCLIKQEQFDGANTTNGRSYWQAPLANFITEVGKVNDLGLLLKVAPYVLLKRGCVGDWALFVQLFGIPFREYTYDPFNPISEEILKKNAEEQGAAPYIILPNGAQVKIHDIKNGNNAEVFQSLKDACDEQITILFLGSTETTKSSSSSGYAQSETHANVCEEYYKGDKLFIESFLEHNACRVLNNLGFNCKGGKYQYKQDVKLEDILKRIDVFMKAKELGIPFDHDQFYEETGINKPKDYEAQMAKKEKETIEPQPKDNRPGQGKDADILAAYSQLVLRALQGSAPFH